MIRSIRSITICPYVASGRVARSQISRGSYVYLHQARHGLTSETHQLSRHRPASETLPFVVTVWSTASSPSRHSRQARSAHAVPKRYAAVNRNSSSRSPRPPRVGFPFSSHLPSSSPHSLTHPVKIGWVDRPSSEVTHHSHRGQRHSSAVCAPFESGTPVGNTIPG